MNCPVITSYGFALQAKAMAGTVITFTKLEVGDGAKPTDPSTLDAIVSPIKSVPISSYKIEDNCVTFTGSYNTQDLTESFTCREVGLYAMAADDSTEHLYAYFNYESNAYVVTKSETIIVEEQISMGVAVGNSANVTATISGNYATTDDLTSGLAEKQDTLVAGDNITIASDGKTISAKDTVYDDTAIKTRVSTIESLESTWNSKAGNIVNESGAEIFNAYSGQYANSATGNYSHAEGMKTIASGMGTHSENYSTTASGSYSHAEGYITKATNMTSHSEGSGTVASGQYSHAENYGTTASGQYSHAEGNGTEASAPGSHAEGSNTKASHIASHASGLQTKTGANYQTVIGKYNVGSSSNAFEIGWGSSSATKNIFSVGTSGNVTATGTISGSSESGEITWASHVQSTSNPRLKKFGQVVSVSVSVTLETNISGDILVGTLSTGFIPGTKQVNISAYTASGVGYPAIINTSGQIWVTVPSTYSSEKLYINGNYVI